MNLRRKLLGSVTVITIVATLCLGTLTAGAASWTFHQLDADSCYDAATIDYNYNGYFDHIAFDTDNDCNWDTQLWNSFGSDTFLENLFIDMNENGYYEYFLFDNNQLGGFDRIRYNLSPEDGAWDIEAQFATIYVGGGSNQSLGTMLFNTFQIGWNAGWL